MDNQHLGVAGWGQSEWTGSDAAPNMDLGGAGRSAPEQMQQDIDLLKQLLRQRHLTSVYQPLVHLPSQRIFAWEALSRGPQNTSLYQPTPLFKLAREQGMLVDLENLSREQALKGFARQSLPGRLFINISPDLLIQKEHQPGRTLAWVQALGLQAHQVVIELTEQQPTEDYVLMRQAIRHYRDMGFQVALDDLGSGYSGLIMWSELRPDFVKIDRHFVQGIHQDPVKEHFVRFILNTAQALGTQVIAEGVETALELACLARLGVMLVQGYYFARPSSHPEPSLSPALFELPEPWSG